VKSACYGGCPKDRFTLTDSGEPGLNYLCARYLAFFHHIDEPMKAMAARLRAGGEAADVMALYPITTPDVDVVVAGPTGEEAQ
jgi:uncharacterized protein